MSTREASAGKSITVSEIAITGVCIALTFVATGFINIRLPIAANGGLVHLGNVPLFLAAIIFGKRTGALAGSIGMALFDLMGGWVLWAPFTFVVVGLMGYSVGAITEKHHGFRWNVLAIAVACVLKIVGYYIAEGYHLWKLDCTGSIHSGQPGSDWCGSCSGSSDCRSSQKSHSQIREELHDTAGERKSSAVVCSIQEE